MYQKKAFSNEVCEEIKKERSDSLFFTGNEQSVLFG